MKNIEDFIKQNSFLKDLYDVIRIIEPITNKVILISDGKEKYLEGSCYKFWGRSKKCANCITMRAYINNKTYMKIEYNKENSFLITAAPINVESRRYVVELLKNITEIGIVENIDRKIQNAIQDMNDLIIKDELTGIYNRRFINEQLPSELANSKLNQSKLTVMMIDIDDFKPINDNYGHLYGDFLIVQVSNFLRDKVSENIGWVARYGGDEFFAVLNNISKNEAIELAESLRKEISEKIYVNNNKKITLSISIGMFFCGDKELNTEEVISNVDKNLYIAKNKGKNSICFGSYD